MAAGSGDGILILQGADPIDLVPGTDVINLNGSGFHGGLCQAWGAEQFL